VRVRLAVICLAGGGVLAALYLIPIYLHEDLEASVVVKARLLDSDSGEPCAGGSLFVSRTRSDIGDANMRSTIASAYAAAQAGDLVEIGPPGYGRADADGHVNAILEVRSARTTRRLIDLLLRTPMDVHSAVGAIWVQDSHGAGRWVSISAGTWRTAASRDRTYHVFDLGDVPCR
jgi:hypothetical protein